MSFIYLTLFLDALGMGLVIPVLPDVLRRFSVDPDGLHWYFGFFVSIYALMQFLAAPILGSLSDRYGRRPLLLLSMAGAGVDYCLMGFAPNLAWLFVGRVVSGLTGASMAVGGSYIADISNDQNRAQNFGRMSAIFGAGFIGAPALGGWIGGLFGPTAPFFFAGICSLLNVVLGLLVLKESLPVEQRRALDGNVFNPLPAFRKVASLSRPLLGVYILYWLAAQIYPSLWTLSMQHRLQWNSFHVGSSMALMGLLMIVVRGKITELGTRLWGEPKALRIGIFFYGLGFVLYGFISESWHVYAIIIGTALAQIAGPLLQAQFAARAGPEEQGEVQGTLVAIAAVTEVAGPLAYVALFNATQFSGAPFVLAGLGCFLAVLLLPKRL